jgi:hypothetical protein
LELTDAWAQEQCNSEMRAVIAPVAGWRCFSFQRVPAPVPITCIPHRPTGKLVGEHSNRNQGDYHDEQK